MRKKVFAFLIILVSLVILLSLLTMLQVTQTEDSPFMVTPTKPINDPPIITIQSPSNTTYNQNIIPLNITITQPDSWVESKRINESELVIGPNSIKSIACKLDGQQFTLWNGTLIRTANVTYILWNGTIVSEANTTKLPISQFAIDHLLPKISQFSATLTAGKGAHTLQVYVLSVTTYYPYADFHFPYTDNIDASQNVTFTVETDLATSKLQGIDAIHTPAVFLNRSYPNITVTIPTSRPPEVPPYPLPKLYPFPTSQIIASDYWLSKTTLATIVIVMAVVAVALGSLVYFKRRRRMG
jgi:hypothetical protein